MPRNTRQSPMWEVFRRLENGYTKCIECDHVLKHSENTTNMWNHTKSKHPNKYMELVRKHKIKCAAPKPIVHNKPNRVIVATINPVQSVHSTLKKCSRMARSSVWEAFERLENGCTKCFDCGIILKWREGTTTMWNHMRRKHPDRFNELFRNQRQNAPQQITSVRSVQPDGVIKIPVSFPAPKIIKKIQTNPVNELKVFTAPENTISVTTIQPNAGSETTKNIIPKTENAARLFKTVRLPPSMQKKETLLKTSAVWKVFEPLTDGFTKCLHCAQIIKCSDYNTSNMWSHIKSSHINIYKNIKQMKRHMTRKKKPACKKSSAAVIIPVVVPGKCRLCVSTSATLRPDQLVLCFDTIEDELSVAHVLNHHFSFDPLVRELHAAAFVCLPCWNKVSAFHQFYQSVLTMHQIENDQADDCIDERISPTTSGYFSLDVDGAQASCSYDRANPESVGLPEMPPLDIKPEFISDDDDEDEYSYYVHSDRGACTEPTEHGIVENSAYSIDDFHSANQHDYADDSVYATDVVMSCEGMEPVRYKTTRPTIELPPLDIKNEPPFEEHRLAEAATTSRRRAQTSAVGRTNARIRPPMLRWYGKVSDQEKSKNHQSKFI